jgi:hypothetical protein
MRTKLASLNGIRPEVCLLVLANPRQLEYVLHPTFVHRVEGTGSNG